MIGVARSRLGATNYDSKVHSGSIVYVPLETIRGTSFEDSVVLVDEAQNLDYEEVKAVTTRIGEGSRMVLMGDPMQRDIRDSGLSEFEGLVHHYGLETEIPIIKFTVDDIVRSDLVATLVRTFMLHEGASHGT
jgi:phosphate starvation-inducible PhoH-like protein